MDEQRSDIVGRLVTKSLTTAAEIIKRVRLQQLGMGLRAIQEFKGKRIEEEYFNKIESRAENVNVNFREDLAGLAVMGDTLIGDGQFEVYQRVNAKGQKELRIVF